jgi:hypothetical protein
MISFNPIHIVLFIMFASLGYIVASGVGLAWGLVIASTVWCIGSLFANDI